MVICISRDREILYYMESVGIMSCAFMKEQKPRSEHDVQMKCTDILSEYTVHAIQFRTRY